VLTILPEALRQFADYRMVVYSLLLILIMIFKPGGLLGSYDFSMSRTLEHLINRDFRRAKREEKAAEQERGEQNV
jgi:branched-chain amino acid transport system permease protein